MARSDFLIKVGDYKIPYKYIKYDTWQSTLETLDLDSYRDGNADLHRNALANRKIKVEFETPHLYENNLNELMSNIHANFLTEVEQDANITAYIDELGDYVTQRCYLVNVTPKVAQNSPNGVIYQPTRIAFIGY